MSRYFPLIALLALSACKTQSASLVIPTAAAIRQNHLEMNAFASGVTQPEAIVDIKSKASGQIVKLIVETGDHVKAGDVLVQIDTQLVRQALDQALADSAIAVERYQLQVTQRIRDSVFHSEGIMTDADFETEAVDVANAKAALDKSIIAVATARTNFSDATVRAPIDGMILTRQVAEGSMVQSSTGAVSSGTTLLRMADMTRMKMIAQFSESDISNIEPGQSADLAVDAYPEESFPGTVERIEPIATVNQTVTLFPVTVSMDNPGEALKMGMSANVLVHVADRDNVLTIPNEALIPENEIPIVAAMLNWDPDSLAAHVAELSAIPIDSAIAASEDPEADDSAAPAPATVSGRHYSRATRELHRRAGIVFVSTPTGWEPRVPVVGIASDTETEVVAGLAEGDEVAVLTLPFLQAAREAGLIPTRSRPADE